MKARVRARRRQQPQDPPTLGPSPPLLTRISRREYSGAGRRTASGPRRPAMPHDRRPGDPRRVQQVPQPRREGAHGIVAPRFCRAPVAEQIRGDHPVVRGLLRDDRLPGVRAAGHAVNQHHDLTAAGLPQGDALTVQFGGAYSTSLLTTTPAPGGRGLTAGAATETHRAAALMFLVPASG
jgi:hypothetical protein